MEREQREIVTPIQKKKIKMYAYLTGRELEYVQEPLFQAMQVKSATVGKDVELGGLDINKMRESSHRLIEKYIISVDGNKDKVLDQVLDMRHEDYQSVLDELNKSIKKN